MRKREVRSLIKKSPFVKDAYYSTASNSWIVIFEVTLKPFVYRMETVESTDTPETFVFHRYALERRHVVVGHIRDDNRLSPSIICTPCVPESSPEGSIYFHPHIGASDGSQPTIMCSTTRWNIDSRRGSSILEAVSSIAISLLKVDYKNAFHGYGKNFCKYVGCNNLVDIPKDSSVGFEISSCAVCKLTHCAEHLEAYWHDGKMIPVCRRCIDKAIQCKYCGETVLMNEVVPAHCIICGGDIGLVHSKCNVAPEHFLCARCSSVPCKACGEVIDIDEITKITCARCGTEIMAHNCGHQRLCVRCANNALCKRCGYYTSYSDHIVHICMMCGVIYVTHSNETCRRGLLLCKTCERRLEFENEQEKTEEDYTKVPF